MAIIAFQPGPGALVLALWCDDGAEYDDYWRRAEAGTLSFDGNRIAGLARDACDREALFIRFNLAGPYVPPPLVLHFEDVALAESIGELGWYTFEGGLHRAEHLGEGRLLLDRVYAQAPPPIYHGRALLEPEESAADTCSPADSPPAAHLS